MVSSRKLSITALLLVLVPVAVALVCAGIIQLIPGCNPNPYSLGGCRVLSINLSGALLLGWLGGFYAAIVLGIFVSLPLFIGSVILALARRSSASSSP